MAIAEKKRQKRRNAKNWKGVPGFYEQIQANPEKITVLNNDQKDKLTVTLAALLVLDINKGSVCIVTLKDGTQYDGIYDYINPSDLSTKLRLAKRVGTDKLVSFMDILGKDIMSIEFKELDSLAADLHTGFQTDTAISKAQGPAKERVLQKWVPEEGDAFLSLDDTPTEKWDQFAVNEKKFGVSTDFKEEMYTTTLNKAAPGFKDKEREAARIAKEIETQSTKNLHLAEERGQKVNTSGMDEEELYSSVHREKGNFSDAVKSKPAMAKKPSAEQLKRSNLTKGLKESIVKPPSKVIPVAAMASQPQSTVPIVEELKRNFKPFAEDLKGKLNSRKEEISKVGRKGIIEELKQFSKEFHIPNNIKKKSEENLEPVKEKETKPVPIAAKPTKPETMSSSVDAKKVTEKVERPAVAASEHHHSPEIPESVISEADSQATNNTTATTGSKAKGSFKLSAKAPTFTPKGFVPIPEKGKPYKNQPPPQQFYPPYQEGGYYPDPNMYYGYANFRPPFPPGVPMIPQGAFVPGAYPMYMAMGPDMRPPMYPPNMMPAPYGMPPPPGWYENMPRPVEMSAQDFQDEEMQGPDEAEDITH